MAYGTLTEFSLATGGPPKVTDNGKLQQFPMQLMLMMFCSSQLLLSENEANSHRYSNRYESWKTGD